MAKKFVRGVTGVKDIENFDISLTNVNDIISDGQHTYIHTKKGETEGYYNLTNNINGISSSNTDLIDVTNSINTTTLNPKHDAQKEQVLDSTRDTVTINHGRNGTTEKTTVDTNPEKVLEHENLVVGDGLSVSHSGSISKIQLEPSLKNAVKGLRKISTSAGIVAPYDDLNTLPVNTVVLYAYFDGVSNKPTGVNGGATVLTYNHASGSDISGAVQILTAPNGDVYTRNFWGLQGTDEWKPWKKIVTENSIATIPDVKNSVKGLRKISTSAGIVAPYDDLNTLPVNTVVLYAYFDGVSNKPTGVNGGATVLTYNHASGSDISGAVQILTAPNGDVYTRNFWGLQGTDEWKPWKKMATEDDIKNSVKGLRKISTSAGIVAPYDDLNTLPVNTVVLYTYFDGVSNAPTDVKWGATVLTYNHASGSDISGAVQILTAPNGDVYTRNFWGLPGTDEWKPWKKMATEHDFNPSLALFEKIGVIGDSYASGEIFPDGTPVDQYSISWGQILARKNGVSCTNFSAGGLTTRHWLLNKNGLTKLNATEPQNLYYISLGINDKNNLGVEYIGTEADMESGADTFYGNYARIINAIKAKAPHAKIILIDYAWSTGKTDPFFVATKNIANKYGLPLIKHSDDPYLASQQFKTDLMSHGHPVAISYAAMASSFEKLTIQAIRDNIEYFKDYRG